MSKYWPFSFRLWPKRQGAAGREQNTLLNPKTSPGRGKVLVAVFLLGFAGLAGRAFYLQAYNAEFLRDKGLERHTRTFALPASRGRILDRNGELLAASVRGKTVFIQVEDFREKKAEAASGRRQQMVPKTEAEMLEQLRQLSPLVEMPYKQLRQRIMGRERGYVELLPRTDERHASQIMALGFNGVHAKTAYRRDYPQGETVSQVVGLSNHDLQGVEGIERSYNELLQGIDGKERIVRRPSGVTYEYEVLQNPVHGQDIHLSIDSRIQFMAYQKLRDAVRHHKAESGSLVMLDARTGEVLAMANYPSFDPANRKSIRPELIRNPAVMDMYEPGSTIKPLLVALGLETQRITPHTLINTEGGRLRIHGANIRDTSNYGEVTVSKAIQKSSNVAMVKIAQRLDSRDMWEFYKSVGLGQKPSLQFPSTASGILRHHKSWLPIEKATISYGYGISASLLQMAQAYTIFCADGYFLPATLDKQPDMILGERIISSQHAQQMRSMMHSVTEKGGTATRAAIEGYTVGGKSGTARKQVGKGYAQGQYVGYFVGFAPVSNPRVITAVMINRPTAGDYYGGVVAAPVFREATSQALQILQVRPDKHSAADAKEGQP